MKHLNRTTEEFTDKRRMPQYIPNPAAKTVETVRGRVPAAHYLWVLWRNKWAILAFIATCVFVTYLVTSRLAPVYEATTRVEVQPNSANGASRTAADADQVIATQMELLRSDAVLRPVAERLNLENAGVRGKGPAQTKNAPISLKHLKVTRPANSYVLRISYRATDPQLAADVANGVADSYIEHTFGPGLRAGSDATTSFAQQQLAQSRSRRDNAAAALAANEQQADVTDLQAQMDALSTRMNELNPELTALRNERMRREGIYHELENYTPTASRQPTQWDELNAAADRVAAAKQQFSKVAESSGPNRADYRQALRDLSQATRQLGDVRRALEQRASRNYRAALAREQRLQKTIAQLKTQYDQAAAQVARHDQFRKNADAANQAYLDIESRLSQGPGESALQAPVRIADRARPPERPVFPDMRLNLIVALLGSCLLAIGAVFGSYVLHKTIDDPEDAARAFQANVLGMLPKAMRMRILPGPMTRSLAAAASASSAYVVQPTAPMTLVRYTTTANGPAATLAPAAESGNVRSSGNGRPRSATAAQTKDTENFESYLEAVRALSRSMIAPDLDRDVRTLQITSAVPGEGKSTAAIHLAIAFAESGNRVLLVDADVRRPSIHFKLNMNNTAGLSNVLLGDVTWRETVVNTGRWPELDIIPAGIGSRRGSGLLGSMIGDILDDTAREYDFVFIDTPSVLGFAEASQVASAVDRVVMIVRVAKTTRDAVAKSLETLNRARANVLGLVLNGVEKMPRRPYYYLDQRKEFVETGA